MTSLAPYNQRQIDGDFVLTELQKIKIGKASLKNFRLTSTWNVFGDSYTAISELPSWATTLGVLTNTTVNNRALGGTEVDRALVINSLDIFSNPSFNNSSIIMFGTNDCRRTTPLYNNYQAYYQACLATYLTLAVPQNKMVMAIDAIKKPSAALWTGPSFGVGVHTVTEGASLEAQVSGRYVAVFMLVNQTNENNNPFQIFVNGVLKSNVQWLRNIAAEKNTFHVICGIVDMQTSATRTVEIVNTSPSTNQKFFNGFAGWDHDDVDARHVLVATGIQISEQNYQEKNGGTVSNTDDKHLKQKSAQIAAATHLRSMGLPVFVHDTPYEKATRDTVHADVNESLMIATKMLNSSIIY